MEHIGTSRVFVRIMPYLPMNQQYYNPPLIIYVLWHRAFKEGQEDIANSIDSAFSRDVSQPASRGIKEVFSSENGYECINDRDAALEV